MPTDQKTDPEEVLRWSSESGMTCYRIKEPSGDPDKRIIEWCRGDLGEPTGDAEWKDCGDNVAACYEIIRLRNEVDRLRSVKEEYLAVAAEAAREERASIRKKLLAVDWPLPARTTVFQRDRLVREIVDDLCPKEGS